MELDQSIKALRKRIEEETGIVMSEVQITTLFAKNADHDAIIGKFNIIMGGKNGRPKRIV